jgi:hypothetical protein
MTRRREAISAQLGSLREMMAGFGEDDAEATGDAGTAAAARPKKG